MSMTFGGSPAGGPAPAPMGDLIKDSNTQAFMKDVIEASRQQPVIVDFWAPWCGPCRMVAPLVDQIADENVGKFAVGKVNVDEAADIAAEFGIQSIPTLIIFKGGQKVDQIVGAGFSKQSLVTRVLAHA